MENENHTSGVITVMTLDQMLDRLLGELRSEARQVGGLEHQLETAEDQRDMVMVSNGQMRLRLTEQEELIGELNRRITALEVEEAQPTGAAEPAEDTIVHSRQGLEYALKLAIVYARNGNKVELMRQVRRILEYGTEKAAHFVADAFDKASR